MSDKRKLPVKVGDFALNGDFEGWTFTGRTNPPVRVVADIQSGILDRIIPSLTEVIKSWNFVDEEGEPMDDPSPASIAELPLDLMKAVIEAVTDRVTKVPNG